MNNTFTKELYDKIYKHISNGLVTGSDRINKEKFEEAYLDNFEVIRRKIDDMTYQFTRFEKKERNNRYVYIPTIRDRVTIEYLKWNVQRKYKIRIKSRDKIIDELRCLLNEPISYSVIRLDIKSFFDNIDHDILVDKLKRNSLFTTQELYLVRNLLDKTNKGVPQGLGISNYLAEIFMENFDIRISKSSYRVSYYARYVDDIIMLIPGKMTTSELDELSTEIDTVFKMYKLELNEKKTKKMYLDSKSSYEFDYLGYCFKKEKRKLVMEIAPNKMGKFFGKIDLMFEEFELSNNFQLLCERMRVFTSVNMLFKTVYILEKDMDIRYYKIPIKFGLNYDYKYASPECINRINAYLKRKIIYTSRMCRKEKKMLYSLLLKQPNENYRLIVYSKIGLMNLKSIVYRIYDGEYKWSDIMCMTRTQLISLYFANAKEHIL